MQLIVQAQMTDEELAQNSLMFMKDIMDMFPIRNSYVEIHPVKSSTERANEFHPYVEFILDGSIVLTQEQKDYLLSHPHTMKLSADDMQEQNEMQAYRELAQAMKHVLNYHIKLDPINLARF